MTVNSLSQWKSTRLFSSSRYIQIRALYPQDSGNARDDDDDDVPGSTPTGLLHWRRPPTCSTDDMGIPVYSNEELLEFERIHVKQQEMMPFIARGLVRIFRGLRKALTPWTVKEGRQSTRILVRRFKFNADFVSVPALVLAGTQLLRDDNSQGSGGLDRFVNMALSSRAHGIIWSEFSGKSRTSILHMAGQGLLLQGVLLATLFSKTSVEQAAMAMKQDALRDYFQALQLYRAGRVADWEVGASPELAIKYWGLAKDAKIGEMLRCCIADEVGHIFVSLTPFCKLNNCF